MTSEEILHDVKDLLQSVINGNEKLIAASFDKEALIVTTESRGEEFEWSFRPDEDCNQM